jgi:hypothetical protein
MRNDDATVRTALPWNAEKTRQVGSSLTGAIVAARNADVNDRWSDRL